MPHHTGLGKEPAAAERRVQRTPAPAPRAEARAPATAVRLPMGARVPPRPGGPAEVLALQGVMGNAAVMRMLSGAPAAVQRVEEEREEEDEPVQRAERGAKGPTDAEVHAAAAEGVRTPSGPLPFVDRIQASFGPAHPVGHVQAHVGAEATRASHAMGARAFATGSHVAFAGTPDAHTAAHEAAHVIQQQAGVQLAGGVGRAGDAYERHADAVADAVVAGRSAEALLEPFAAPVQGGKPASSPGVSLLDDPVQPLRLSDTEAVEEQRALIRDVFELADDEFSFVMRDEDEVLAGSGNCHGYTFTRDPDSSFALADVKGLLQVYPAEQPMITVFFLGKMLAHSAVGHGEACEHKVGRGGMEGPVIRASAASVGRGYHACFELPGGKDEMLAYIQSLANDSDSDNVDFSPR